MVWRRVNRKNPEETLQRLKACFEKDFWRKPLIEITIEMVEFWKTNKLVLGMNPTTVNRDVADMRAVLSKAVEWDVISISPLSKLKQCKVDSSPKIRFLSAYEEESLRTALITRDDRLKEDRENSNKWRLTRHYQLLPSLLTYYYGDHLTPMVLLSLNTGLRRSECMGLKWHQIDFEVNVLTVLGANSKSSQTRHVPLNKEAVSVLKNWRQQCNKIFEYVFCNDDGEPFHDVRTAWGNLLKSALITNFRWHDMRHHFASMLIMKGVDLNTVRELLGHADLQTTLRYAHLAISHKSQAVARLDLPRSSVSFMFLDLNRDLKILIH